MLCRLPSAFFVVIFTCLALPGAATAQAGRFLIRGNVVTPGGVIGDAWIDVADGRIVGITAQKPDAPGVPAIETGDLIFPGFIDLHNHPTFNIFPRWTPPHTFPNRYAWRDWPVYLAQLEDQERQLPRDAAMFCDVDEYVEVRALIGGTTSMIGFAGPNRQKVFPPCIKGLVRNLDVYTGWNGPEAGHERIVNSVGILPRDMDAASGARIARGIADGNIDLLAIHIAEGLPTDPETEGEFDLLDKSGLLTAHTALIHAVGLSPAQLARVHRVGASIVWSPHSNFVLYGATANIKAAVKEDVTISLAPDWAPTGSDNMLNEIKYAHSVDREKLGGILSSRQLVEMASIVPARVAHIDDKVGTLASGKLADFFLVHTAGLGKNPYEALVRANVTNIDIVVIGGVPVYGDPLLLRKLGVETERINVCGAERALNAAALPAGSFAQVTARLKEKMATVGSELAPLAECAP